MATDERVLTIRGNSATRRLSEFLMKAQMFGLPAGEYYVDGNVSSSGDGSVRHPIETLEEAISVSNTSIASDSNRWWARRNKIWVCGDGEIEENLTVWPEKCDIIGFGTDLLPFPRIIGNHAVAAATVGVRLINLGFYTKTTADLMSWPAASHGLQILGCFMYPGATAAKAIEITDSAHVRIIGNEITVRAGDAAQIFGVGISIEGSASIHDTIIEDNLIYGTVGVHVVEAGAAAFGSRINHNIIRATGFCVNEASDDFFVTNNTLFSDAADDGSGTGGSALAMNCNLQLAAGNRLTCSGDLNAPYPPEATLGS